MANTSKRLAGGIVGLGLAAGVAGFAGYEMGKNEPRKVSAENIQEAAVEIAKACGQTALNEVVKTDEQFDVVKLSDQQITQLRGLQAQVETAQATCFNNAVVGPISEVSSNLPTPVVQGTISVGAKQ